MQIPCFLIVFLCKWYLHANAETRYVASHDQPGILSSLDTDLFHCELFNKKACVKCEKCELFYGTLKFPFAATVTYDAAVQPVGNLHCIRGNRDLLGR